MSKWNLIFVCRSALQDSKNQINPEEKLIKHKLEAKFDTMTNCKAQWEPHYRDNEWMFALHMKQK